MTLHVHIERLVLDSGDGRPPDRQRIEAQVRREILARVSADGLPSLLRASAARADLPREDVVAARGPHRDQPVAPQGIGAAICRSLDR